MIFVLLEMSVSLSVLEMEIVLEKGVNVMYVILVFIVIFYVLDMVCVEMICVCVIINGRVYFVKFLNV